MLQALLEDRFGLKVHQETREGSVYFLVIAKGGSKMHESLPEAEAKFVNADGTPYGGYAERTKDGAIAHAYSAAQIARLLSGETRRPVIDKTGLTGTYDFTLQWQRRLTADVQSNGGDNGDAPEPGGGLSIFAAVQQQLGLKLQPGKGPIEFIVIDQVEKPSEN
jgi:uncharacterized protein (TIGR03435 family)